MAEGGISVPPRAEIEGRPYVFFAEGPSHRHILAHFPKVLVQDAASESVWVEEAGINLARVIKPAGQNNSYWLTNVTLELTEGDHSGWIGIEPSDSSSNILVTDDQLQVETRNHSDIGSDRPSFGEPTPPSFWIVVDEPHLYGTANGTAHFLGAGMLMLNGPDVVLRADENVTFRQTGKERTSEVEARLHWLILRFSEAEIEYETATGSITVALGPSKLSWGGSAFIEQAAGSLRTPEGDYVVNQRQPVHLHGNLTAGLLPLNQAGRLLTVIEVSGDTSAGAPMPGLFIQRLPAPAGGSTVLPLTLLPLALGLVAVGGAAGAFAAQHRLRRRSPRAVGFSGDDCLGFARQYAEDAAWGQALEWAQRARKMAPRSARAWQLEGWALVNLGCYDEALEAYDEAFRISPDGPGAYEVARVTVQADRPPEVAERWLAKALRHDPALVEELLDDHAFQDLLRRPSMERLVDEALGRLSERSGVAR